MFWPYHMSGMGWGGWIVGGLAMLLFFGALLALIFLLIRAGSANQSRGRQPESGSDALDILKLRYAHGEISKTEYEEIRHDLGS
ncbi:MAG: SHOCT domain-containing protein [Anaerolineales bacterium]|nr:SHOCT domain-containing protein [Anaerolineales bacterium]